MDKSDLIINLLRDGRKDHKKLEDKVVEIAEDIAEMKVEVTHNRLGLDEHMAQTQEVRNTVKVTEKHLTELIMAVREEANDRTDNIEKRLTVAYLLKLVVTVASGIGVISGTIYGVIKLFKNIG